MPLVTLVAQLNAIAVLAQLSREDLEKGELETARVMLGRLSVMTDDALWALKEKLE